MSSGYVSVGFSLPARGSCELMVDGGPYADDRGVDISWAKYGAIGGLKVSSAGKGI